jgi:hypothetical protein
VPDSAAKDLVLTGSQRRCVVTGTVADKADMIRLAGDPEGTVIPDVAEKLPGRGAWVLADPQAVAGLSGQKAARRLARQLGQGPIRGIEELPARLDRRLAAYALESLSLARRAGTVQAGFDKVHGAVKAGDTLLLGLAREAGDDSTDRLLRLAGGVAPDIPVTQDFDGVSIASALGRDHVVFFALTAGMAHGTSPGLARRARVAAAAGSGPKDAPTRAKPNGAALRALRLIGRLHRLRTGQALPPARAMPRPRPLDGGPGDG